MIKIIKNRIKCNHCGDIITSEYTHDFKTCQCGMVSVDGGKSYMKRCYKNSQADYEDLSVWEDVEDDDAEEKSLDKLSDEDSETDQEKIRKLMEWIANRTKEAKNGY